MTASMNIGDAARLSGLTPKMIRYYEQTGLLPDGRRSSAGYRLYSESDLHQLHFIRRARDLGFSLKQIAELLALWRDRNRASADVQRLAMAHIAELEDKARQLTDMANTLRNLAQHCHGDDRPDCPILDGLVGQSCCATDPGATPPGRYR